MTTVCQQLETLRQQGKGVTPEDIARIRQRAREIAMNRGRSSKEPTEEDWLQAERECLCLQTSRGWNEQMDRFCRGD